MSRYFVTTSSLVVFILALLTYWNGSYFVLEKALDHNMMESLLVGSAPLHSLGVPYRDYWGIYPPGIYLLMSLFDLFFQGNLIVFKVLHITLVFATLVIFWRLTLKLVPKKYHMYSNVLTIISAFFYCSSSINNVMISSVLIGNLLGLIGLWLLLYSKKIAKYGLSAAIFTWAAMIKDPYELLVLLPFLTILIEYIFEQKKIKKIISIEILKKFSLALVGTVVILIIHTLYLLRFGVISAYLNVLEFKKESFLNYPTYPNNFEGTFTFFQLFFKDLFFTGEIILPFIIIILFLVAYFRKANILARENIKYFVVLLFVLLNFITFKIQDRIGATYTLQVILPFFLSINTLFAIIIDNIIKKTIHKRIIFTLIACSIIVFLPRGTVWRPFILNKMLGPRTFITYIFSSTNNQSLLADQRIQNILKIDNRVLDIYGWGTPNFYYRYKVKPFNRFFIVHPFLMGDKQNKEWVLSFAQGLPKVVVYGGGPGADMNVDEFENKTIQVQKLLNDCYTRINADVYLLASGYCDSFSKNPEKYVNNSFVAYFK